MSAWEQREERRRLPEDRLFDDDKDRLRDAAAHLIDAVRALVRRRLEDPGVHPEEALDAGVMMLEQWMEARGATGYARRETADQITQLVHRLLRVMRPKDVLLFHIEPHDELDGMTPIECHVRHSTYKVERLVSEIEARVALAELEHLGDEENDAK